MCNETKGLTECPLCNEAFPRMEAEQCTLVQGNPSRVQCPNVHSLGEQWIEKVTGERERERERESRFETSSHISCIYILDCIFYVVRSRIVLLTERWCAMAPKPLAVICPTLSEIFVL